MAPSTGLARAGVSSGATQTQGAGRPPAVASQGWGTQGCPEPSDLALRAWVGHPSHCPPRGMASSQRLLADWWAEAARGPGWEGSGHRAGQRSRHGEDRSCLVPARPGRSPTLSPPSLSSEKANAGRCRAGPHLSGSLSRCWAQPCPHLLLGFPEGGLAGPAARPQKTPA